MEKKSIVIIIILIILGVCAGISGYYVGSKKAAPSQAECKKEEPKKEESNNDGYIEISNKHWEKRTDNEVIRKYKNFVSDDNLEYDFHWNNEKVLTVSYSISGAKWVENVKIAENVKMFDVIHTGNAGYYNLYYLTEDGKVYCVYLDDSLLTNKELVPKELDDLKDIEFFSEFSGPSGSVPLFVDKDGNIVLSGRIN